MTLALLANICRHILKQRLRDWREGYATHIPSPSPQSIQSVGEGRLLSAEGLPKPAQLAQPHTFYLAYITYLLDPLF
jgi:hypothetical protein